MYLFYAAPAACTPYGLDDTCQSVTMNFDSEGGVETFQK